MNQQDRITTALKALEDAVDPRNLSASAVLHVYDENATERIVELYRAIESNDNTLKCYVDPFGTLRLLGSDHRVERHTLTSTTRIYTKAGIFVLSQRAKIKVVLVD